MLDYLKVVLPFLGGGLFGGLIVEWLRRRGARIQVIPLIIRMNRRVKADIAGFTLARITGPDTPPEVIADLREYQFTLRNTSNVHLQNAEIEFEFPCAEVQALAERPARSNTALVELECAKKGPQRTLFRWRIPQFPATDSIDFTFRAINTESGDFEVSLHNSDRVVVQASKGEPSQSDLRTWIERGIAVPALLLCLLLMYVGFSGVFQRNTSTTYLIEGECNLVLSSSYRRVDYSFWPWAGGPWQVTDEVMNSGDGHCSVQPVSSSGAPPPPVINRISSVYSRTTPRLLEQDLMLGPADQRGIFTPKWNVKAKLYIPQN